MDFFEAQDQARSRSGRLMVYFALAVAAIVVAIYSAVTGGVFYYHSHIGKPFPPFWDFSRFAYTAGGVVSVIALGSWWRIAQLRRSGGTGVAVALGGRRVAPASRRFAERQLINIVEEMSIASGVPVPHVYVLDGESGINAFAAGFTLDDAVIGVTRGALEELDRDELQGVIAHEFSHILNGDMRLSTRLSGWLFGIIMLTVLGRGFWALLRGGSGSGGGSWRGGGGGGSGGRSSSGRGNSSGGSGGGGAIIIAVILVAVLITIIGFIGEFFARWIQAAVSREREFLADAAAVQFTRNPEGIVNALRRIGGVHNSARIRSSHRDEFAHAFFGKARGEGVAFFATHPPLRKRIRRLSKDWNGEYLKPRPKVKPALQPTPKKAPRPSLHPTASGGGSAIHSMLTAGFFMQSLGNLREQGQEHAAKIHAALREALPEAFEQEGLSPLLVLAMLVQEDAAISAAQHAIVDEHLPERAQEVRAYAERLRALGRTERLALLEIMATRLDDDLIPSEKAPFAAAVEALVQADGCVSPFELACLQVVRRRLSAAAAVPPRKTDAPAVARAGSVLATRLARESASKHLPLVQILQQASRQAPYFMNHLKPVESTTFAAINEAFAVLEQSPPGVRRQFLEICERIVAADELASSAEVELLRAISFGLSVPAPPLYPTGP